MTQQEYENKIKELQDELEELKAAKIEAEQPKRWKPQCGESYWLVDEFGTKVHYTFRNDRDDKWLYLTGNCFKTAKEAEEYKKQIEYTALYNYYIEEHSEPLDWKSGQRKWYAELKTDEESIEVNGVYTYKQQGVIYASSEEIIWDAIKKIGEDNFKKYVLGVK